MRCSSRTRTCCLAMGGSGEQTIARKSESFRYKRVRGVCPIGPPGNSCRCNACRFHSMKPTVSMERASSASQIHLIEFDEVHSGSGGSARARRWRPGRFRRGRVFGKAGRWPRVDVRGDCGADRPATAGVCVGVRFAAFYKAVWTSYPCVGGAPLGPISPDEQR